MSSFAFTGLFPQFFHNSAHSASGAFSSIRQHADGHLIHPTIFKKWLRACSAEMSSTPFNVVLTRRLHNSRMFLYIRPVSLFWIDLSSLQHTSLTSMCFCLLSKLPCPFSDTLVPFSFFGLIWMISGFLNLGIAVRNKFSNTEYFRLHALQVWYVARPRFPPADLLGCRCNCLRQLFPCRRFIQLLPVFCPLGASCRFVPSNFVFSVLLTLNKIFRFPFLHFRLKSCFQLRVRAVEFAHYSCRLHCFLPRHGQDFASQRLHIDEQHREIFFVDETKHVEQFRAEHSELLVVVGYPVEQCLEVQELQVNLEGMYLGNCNCQGFTQPGSVSDGDLAYSARCRPQLVRTLPMPNFQMQRLHKQEAAKGNRHMRTCVLIVICQIHFGNKSSGHIMWNVHSAGQRRVDTEELTRKKM